MDVLPDPTSITTWPQALVAVALIVGVVLILRNNRDTRHARDNAELAREQAEHAAATADATHKSLQENNGGSSVRDALDRIEKAQTEQSRETAAVAVAVGSLRADFDAHLSAALDTTPAAEQGGP